MIGWSSSDAIRGEMVRYVKQRWPALRVIALYSHSGHAIPEADLNALSEDPAEWFGAVKQAASESAAD